MAEPYFPKEEHRASTAAALGLLALMLVLGVVSVGVILRRRDVH